jgi:hypothetical protein
MPGVPGNTGPRNNAESRLVGWQQEAGKIAPGAFQSERRDDGSDEFKAQCAQSRKDELHASGCNANVLLYVLHSAGPHHSVSDSCKIEPLEIAFGAFRWALPAISIKMR